MWAATDATSRQNGREHNESCKVIGSSKCEGDYNGKASPITVHGLTSDAEHNHAFCANSSIAHKAKTLIHSPLGPPTKWYCPNTLAYRLA